MNEMIPTRRPAPGLVFVQVVVKSGAASPGAITSAAATGGGP